MIHLVIGPVGAGKSTYAKKLATRHGAVRFTLDAWMARLYGDDERPADRVAWYMERVERCLAQILEVTGQVLARGTPVVLEIGLVQRQARERFYGWVDANAFDLAVVVVDAPRDVRRERVLARNEAKGETFSTVVPPEFFELASDAWEPPDEQEQRDRQMAFVDTAGPDLSELPQGSTELATHVAGAIAEWLENAAALLASDATPSEAQAQVVGQRAREFVQILDAVDSDRMSLAEVDYAALRAALTELGRPGAFPMPDGERGLRAQIRASLSAIAADDAEIDALIDRAR